MVDADEGARFPGTERYLARRLLGSGGKGVVYEVYDTERKQIVALKTLAHLDPATLLRFKREFRTLADLVHPNLVTLYDLVAVQDEWFFTMERVEGLHFLAYVRPSTTGCDLDRLLSALGQLATAVCALHAAGRPHRDIKPSNVLMTTQGRVVLCDFGLASERAPEASESSDGSAYRSPERTGSQASDWFSVGVMLFEALTGQLPAQGADGELPPPSQLVAGVPPELDRLCVRLLLREPSARPSGSEVLRQLGLDPAQAAAPWSRRPSAEAPFVGRTELLGALHAALARAHGGTAALVLVHGVSGMGKTSLLQRFTELAGRDANALILSGRCHERESVPYKALDSLIDALTLHLLKVGSAELERLLPSDIATLARMFPVLQRIEAPALAPMVEPLPEPRELRQRAARGLRELLAQLASRPLVIAIDDLQWGDVDSARLLSEVLRPPGAPPLLFLGSYRSEDRERSPFLSALRALWPAQQLDELVLEPLTPSEARGLSFSLWSGAVAPAVAVVDAIALESGGHPLLLHELVRSLERDQGADRAAAPPTLDRVLAARLHQLSPSARTLLAAVAASGRPLRHAVLSAATDLGEQEIGALAELYARHWIRSSGGPRGDNIEVYHHRLGEAALAALSQDQVRECHRRLALALQSTGEVDPEALAEHWLMAGEPTRGARAAMRAAQQAEQALAFDRAAAMYRVALAHGAPDRPAQRALLVRLGEALANGGRGAEAAEAFADAARGASTAESIELRRRTAEQLLWSGHLDRGFAAVGDVLAALGLRMARSPRRALASLLWRRLRLRLRGLRFRRRAAGQVPPDTLARIDVLWSLASGLSMIDTIRGADFQTRHVLDALAAGEPYRIVRALALEITYTAARGGRSSARTERLIERVEALARELDDPRAFGLAATAAGVAAFLRGRWQHAREMCERAESVLRSRSVNIPWQAAVPQFFWLGALCYLGAIAELVRVVPERVREAEARGDFFAAMGLRSWRTNLAWLALDDATEARHQLAQARRQPRPPGFHLQDYYELLSETQIDLYTGCGRAAWRRLGDGWGALSRSQLLRIQNVRVEAHYLRARAALAAHAEGAGAGADEPGLLAQAGRDAGLMARERAPWAQPLAELVRAAVDLRRGNGAQARARARLERAAREFDSADMALHAAATRRRLGELTGGDAGRALAEAAERWMAGQGVRNPGRITAMLAPGLAA